MDTLLQGMIRYDLVDSNAAPGRPTSREEIDREFAPGRRNFPRLTVCGYGRPGALRYDAAYP
jgi:hypothetical protein